MSWTSALALLAALGILALGPVGGVAAEPSPLVSPVSRERPPALPAPASTAETLRLGGPFGSVPGEPPGSVPPAPDDAGTALDAFVRSAPLRLETGRPPVPIVGWRVTGTSLEDGRAAILASSASGDPPTTSVAPRTPGSEPK